jgi:hypothetical protein
MNPSNEELYHFFVRELEYQSKSIKIHAILYGVLGGLVTFATCAVILATCTPEPSTPEPRTLAQESTELRI